jgi:hypothetical protein
MSSETPTSQPPSPSVSEIGDHPYLNLPYQDAPQDPPQQPPQQQQRRNSIASSMSSGNANTSDQHAAEAAASSYTLPDVYKPQSVSVSDVTKVTGSDNYETWATDIKYLLYGIDLDEIVVNGVTPAESATAEQKRLTE